MDVTSRLEGVLVGGGFQLVHVHEPIAPSLAFTSIRESRSPVVSTFHLTPAGLLAYELGQVILSPFYERLDGRVVTASRAAGMLGEFFGGEYRTIFPGTRVGPVVGQHPRAGDGSVEASPARVTCLYVFRGDDRRGLRAFLRALAAAPSAAVDRVLLAVHRPSAERWAPRSVPRVLRGRVEMEWFDTAEELSLLYAQATLAVLPYLGGEWLLVGAAECVVTGCPFFGPDFPVARDFCEQTGQGVLFAPEDESGFGAILATFSGAGGRGWAAEERPSEQLKAAQTMEAVTTQVLALYGEAMSSARERDRRALRFPRRVSRRQQRLLGAEAGRDRGWLYADLHIHTAHSKDSASAVEAVLATARDVGLGAIAIADHNQSRVPCRAGARAGP